MTTLLLKPKRRTVLPGFGLSMGYTMTYLSLLVLIPMLALIVKGVQVPWQTITETLMHPFVRASFFLTLWASGLAAIISAFFGLIIAWTLVRYRFPGRRLIDAIIDLPFALPTAVAGLSFSSLYRPNGWIGGMGHTLVGGINWLLNLFGAHSPVPEHCMDWFGFPAANTKAGIVIVLIFVGFPFVVRTIQPVLLELQAEHEQAAASLGAGRWTTFWRVIWPEIQPAFLTGLALAFARAVGEYGSVIFISNGLPGDSQIVPVQIITQLGLNEKGSEAKAIVIAGALLFISLIILLAINTLEWRSRRKAER